MKKVKKCTLKWERNGRYTTSNLIITRKTNTVTINLRLPIKLCVMQFLVNYVTVSDRQIRIITPFFIRYA